MSKRIQFWTWLILAGGAVAALAVNGVPADANHLPAGKERPVPDDPAELADVVAELQERVASLEERLSQLEAGGIDQLQYVPAPAASGRRRCR